MTATMTEREHALREARFGKVFDLLEHYTPEQRAEVFYLAESRWCWECGHPQSEDDKHADCARLASPEGAPTREEVERG